MTPLPCRAPSLPRRGLDEEWPLAGDGARSPPTLPLSLLSEVRGSRWGWSSVPAMWRWRGRSRTAPTDSWADSVACGDEDGFARLPVCPFAQSPCRLTPYALCLYTSMHGAARRGGVVGAVRRLTP